MNASKVFFELSTDYHRQQRDLRFFSSSIIKLTKEIFQVEDQIKDLHFNVARNHGDVNTQVQRTKTKDKNAMLSYSLRFHPK